MNPGGSYPSVSLLNDPIHIDRLTLYFPDVLPF